MNGERENLESSIKSYDFVHVMKTQTDKIMFKNYSTVRNDEEEKNQFTHLLGVWVSSLHRICSVH